MELVKNANCPDAVMFTSDDPAIGFKKMLKLEKITKQPLVTGFDGWSLETGKDIGDLTTVKVDYEGMGGASVDLMLRNSLEDWHLPDIVRVPCKLIINN